MGGGEDDVESDGCCVAASRELGLRQGLAVRVGLPPSQAFPTRGSIMLLPCPSHVQVHSSDIEDAPLVFLLSRNAISPTTRKLDQKI